MKKHTFTCMALLVFAGMLFCMRCCAGCVELECIRICRKTCCLCPPYKNSIQGETYIRTGSCRTRIRKVVREKYFIKKMREIRTLFESGGRVTSMFGERSMDEEEGTFRKRKDLDTRWPDRNSHHTLRNISGTWEDDGSLVLQGCSAGRRKIPGKPLMDRYYLFEKKRNNRYKKQRGQGS